MRVLILGGTAEARELAEALAGRAAIKFVSSLAGRVRDPRLPVGQVRIGGFGGVEGLCRYLRTEGITAVVDATHPFARTITGNAESATARTGVPMLELRRPAWTHLSPSLCHRVRSMDDVLAAVNALGAIGTVLLTTGRRDLAVFAGDTRRRYVVRVVDPPRGPLPPRTRLILARGPYTVEGERKLMTRHGVDVLVTKDSGGDMTAAKLVAAAQLRIPVIVIDRPPPSPDTPCVTSVAEVVDWLDGLAGFSARGPSAR